jgi:hypothetical protein
MLFDSKLVSDVNRAFSASGCSSFRDLGRCPSLEMSSRLWRDKF